MISFLALPTREDIQFGRYRILTADEIRAVPRFDTLLRAIERRTGGTRLASRQDIRPADFKAELPNVFIWDLIRDQTGRVVDARARLTGTEMSHFYGEITGQRWSDYIAPEVAERAITSCRKISETKQIFAYIVHGITKKQFFVNLYVLYVPLSPDGTTVDQVFGAIALAHGETEPPLA